MGLVGVGEYWVLSYDVEALELPVDGGVEGGGRGEAGLGGEAFDAPGLFELGARRVVADFLISGVDVGEGTHVAGALDVVLPAQGVDAAAGFAEVACEHGEVGATLDVVHAVRMLGDAHGVDDHGRARCGEEARRVRDLCRAETAYFGGPFRRILRHGLFQFVETLGALRDKCLVFESLLEDHVHHAV